MIPTNLEQARSISFSLAVLSLDLTRGTLLPMRLEVSDESAFRAALRGQPLGPIRDDAGIERVASTLRALEAQFGTGFREHLVAWIEEFFLGSGDPQVFLWRCVVQVGDSSDVPQLVEYIREELLRVRHQSPPDVPTSRWDIELLSDWGFPMELTDNEMTSSPMPLIVNHLEDQAFVTAWERALPRTLDPEETIEAMFEWGRTEGIRLNFEHLARPVFRRWPYSGTAL